MNLKGRVVSEGDAQGEAVVLDGAFSLIGDFEASTGILTAKGHPLMGQSIAGKILVFTTGKGGTIAPFIAYEAKAAGKAPAAFLCDKADPILVESALVSGIPLLDRLEPGPVNKAIQTGQKVRIAGNQVTVEN